MNTTQQQNIKKKNSVRQRSPAYPYIDIEKAIAKARVIYNKEKMHSAAKDVILLHWGFVKNSGTGTVIFSALTKYGLLIGEGTGDKRGARLTELAYRIIADERPDSLERDKAITEAALTPTIHKELWVKYKGDLPSDDSLKHELKFNRNFTDFAVDNFIGVLRKTWAFANLTEYVNMSEEESEDEMLNQTATIENGIKANLGSVNIMKQSYGLNKNLNVDILFRGQSDIGTKDIERLQKYLELLKASLEDQ